MMKMQLVSLVLITLISQSYTQTSENVELLSDWPYGVCQTVKLDGDTLYMSNGKVVQIYNVFDLHHPTLVSEFETESLIREIQAANDKLYIGTDEKGLIILDISDLTHPRELGRYPRDDEFQINNLHIVNDTVYTATGDFRVIDATNPEQPELITSINIDFASDIDIKDNFAFISHNTDGTTILDISDVNNITEITSIPTGHNDYGLCVKNDILYIARGRNQVEIFDISDIYNPVPLDTLNFNGFAMNIDVKENFAFVATRNKGVAIADVSDPANAVLVEQFSEAGNIYFVSASNKHKISVGEVNGSVYILNILQDTIPLEIDYQIIESAGQISKTIIQGRYCYTKTGNYGLDIYELTDTPRPEFVNNWRLESNYIDDFEIRNDTAFVVFNYDGLRIVDLTDKSSPQVIGDIEFPDVQVQVELHEQIALIGDDNNTIYVVDFTNPTDPVELTTFNIVCRASDFRLDYPYLFLLEKSKGVYIYNVADYYNPVLLDSIKATDRMNAFACSAPYLFCYDTPGSIRIVEYADNIITEIDTIASGAWIDNMVFKNNKLYIAGGVKDFYILDMSDMDNPVTVGSYKDMNTYDYMDVNNDTIILANTSAGFKILHHAIETGITEFSQSLPTALTLYPNYPNPFNSETTIAYELDRDQQISLNLYNINGQQVRSLYNGYQKTGCHRYHLNAAGLSSGIYFIQLENADQSEMQKCILLK